MKKEAIKNINVICCWTDTFKEKCPNGRIWQDKCKNPAIYKHEQDRPYCAFHSEKADQINNKRFKQCAIDNFNKGKFEAQMKLKENINNYINEELKNIQSWNHKGLFQQWKGQFDALSKLQKKLNNSDFDE